MKKIILSMSTICVIMLSCNNENDLTETNNIERKIQFHLYTTNDYSNNNDSIFFSVFIKKVNNQILWDSTLQAIKIKDIPYQVNKLIINKVVPNNDTSLLKVGFNYAIKNVGYSQFLDTLSSGNNFKIVDFNFN
ncbi:hypothetical protein [Flavobacterium sp. 25HG05S-40]|uniref:hypothetical protein n=1 Tax=Flavobacterium sp. 25HG05S-40 TaxID=3458682 RepID=UPI0040442E1F